MNERDGGSPALFNVAAAVALVIGVLLVLATWDGLYDALDLPKASPGLSAQVGGFALIGLAYALWASAGRPAMEGVAAGAGTIAFGGSALMIALWVIFRSQRELGIDTQGVITLILIAVVLGALALALARPALARRSVPE